MAQKMRRCFPAIDHYLSKREGKYHYMKLQIQRSAFQKLFSSRWSVSSFLANTLETPNPIQKEKKYKSVGELSWLLIELRQGSAFGFDTEVRYMPNLSSPINWVNTLFKLWQDQIHLPLQPNAYVMAGGAKCCASHNQCRESVVKSITRYRGYQKSPNHLEIDYICNDYLLIAFCDFSVHI